MLGILYESLVHPVTILSTIPSAGVGGLLALMLTHTDLTIIAIIGIILLIGIVKKNAIMMIDFALAAERDEGKNSRDSIYEACMLRLRPILMTTMAAMLGALPLALGTGTGSELRRPLGITIIGGLIVSQMLTLYTTPVVYLYFDCAPAGVGQGSALRSGRPARRYDFETAPGERSKGPKTERAPEDRGSVWTAEDPSDYAGLRADDVFRLQPFGALLDLKFHLRTLIERAIAR